MCVLRNSRNITACSTYQISTCADFVGEGLLLGSTCHFHQPAQGLRSLQQFSACSDSLFRWTLFTLPSRNCNALPNDIARQSCGFACYLMFIMKSANETDEMRLSASAQFVSLPIRVAAALIQALMEKRPKSPSTISKAKP